MHNTSLGWSGAQLCRWLTVIWSPARLQSWQLQVQSQIYGFLFSLQGRLYLLFSCLIALL